MSVASVYRGTCHKGTHLLNSIQCNGIPVSGFDLRRARETGRKRGGTAQCVTAASEKVWIADVKEIIVQGGGGKG